MITINHTYWIGTSLLNFFWNSEKIFRHKTFLNEIANFINKAAMIFWSFEPGVSKLHPFVEVSCIDGIPQQSFGPKTIFIPTPPPPSKNNSYTPSHGMSFFQILSCPICLYFSLLYIYFTFLLPILSFSFLLLPFSFLFPLFLFRFSYFFPQMTSADIPLSGGQGYIPIYRPLPGIPSGRQYSLVLGRHHMF